MRGWCERVYTGMFGRVFARIHAHENAISDALRKLSKVGFYKAFEAPWRDPASPKQRMDGGTIKSRERRCQYSPLGGSTGENSSLSPGLVCVSWIVPAASSTTECAERQADSLQAGTQLLTFFTFLFRSR